MAVLSALGIPSNIRPHTSRSRLPFEGLGTASFAFTGLDFHWLRLLHLVIAFRARLRHQRFWLCCRLGQGCARRWLAGPAWSALAAAEEATGTGLGSLVMAAFFWAGCSSADSSTGFAIALGTSGAGGFGASPFGGGGKIRLLAYPGHFIKAGGGGLTFPGNFCSASMPVKAAEELGSDQPEDFASCASTCSWTPACAPLATADWTVSLCLLCRFTFFSVSSTDTTNCAGTTSVVKIPSDAVLMKTTPLRTASCIATLVSTGRSALSPDNSGHVIAFFDTSLAKLAVSSAGRYSFPTRNETVVQDALPVSTCCSMVNYTRGIFRGGNGFPCGRYLCQRCCTRICIDQCGIEGVWGCGCRNGTFCVPLHCTDPDWKANRLTGCHLMSSNALKLKPALVVTIQHGNELFDSGGLLGGRMRL